ncbi:programmed cell death protein 5-like [Mya arenaria]|uniref:programmed cell death protein 5-like n=1 Tax=Mya arenaria TaxID=6604 RepID=UPI0022E382F3|nr:programmed cell death protein 5-like [Mya arenaria]
MADDDLDALRARRMAELQSQMGGGPGGGDKDQEEKARQMEEMKHGILSQVLDQSARTRLNTIAVAKPEKAKMIEGMLIQMARSGQIQGKIDETQLKGLLAQVNERTKKTTTVKFDRRRAALDSDSD